MAKKSGFDKFFDKYKSYFKNPYKSSYQAAEASISPYLSRYQSDIDEYKRQQGVQETDQTRLTNAELARRGITTDSGIGGQELGNVLTVIRDKFGGLMSQRGSQRDMDLANIQNLIAQFKGQGESERMQNAMSLYQLQKQGGQQDFDNAFKLKQFQQYQLPMLQYQIGAPYFKPTSGGGLSLDKIFGI